MAVDFLFSDLHVLTNKSLCAPRETTPASYIPYCKEEGVRLIGISDHVYPEDMLAQYGYPDDKRVGRLLDLRRALREAEAESGIRYLLGCEIDYFPCVGHPYILPEESVGFDYVLFSSSHILNYPTMYSEYDLTSPDVLRELTIERFVATCKLDYPVPMAICHPLYPICSPHQAEIIDDQKIIGSHSVGVLIIVAFFACMLRFLEQIVRSDILCGPHLVHCSNA